MPTSIMSIKNKLDSHLGEQITVVAQAGRKKITKRRGVLKNTFPAVFVVDLDQEQNNFEHVSYSYTDLLTKNIALEFEGEESQTELAESEFEAEDDDAEEAEA
ncbi:Veg family protein [Lactobacillus corticis]|uniref:Veg-like protein n=1 Tax=Lactobacillus corticis TaxID=2201249 RepID=A0A916VHC0_9LACO|nr:Veg family protein [Lactobacillus corticis]GFZ26881.1 Veg-like protein [Lactobacillus corticis]